MNTKSTTMIQCVRGMLLLTAMLLPTAWTLAQPGGQSAGGGQDDENKQVIIENECLRLLEKTRAPESHHYQQPHRPLVVIGEEGTELLIPADAFVFPDGTPVVGEVEIQLTEVANKSELVLSNLPTVSNGRMLVSGGVVKIDAVADGKQLRLAPGKSVLVNFPGGYIPDMQLFKGEYNAAGEMNWVPMADAPGSKTKPMAKIDPAKDLSLPLFLDYGKVNPQTFMFADGEHNLNGYMAAMLKTGYKCVGNDAVYVEMTPDETGRVKVAKTLTGRNPCYRLAIEEIAQTIQFDMSGVQSNTKFYFQMNPNMPVTGGEGENMYASLSGNTDAFNNPQVLAAMREYMEEEKAQNFVKNAFAVTDLGWINCDRFYKEPGERVNVMASVVNPDLLNKAKIYLVFEDMNAVIEGRSQSNGKFVFENIPSGMKAKVVALGYQQNVGPFMKTVDVITKGGQVAAVNMDKVSEDALKKAVASL